MRNAFASDIFDNNYYNELICHPTKNSGETRFLEVKYTLLYIYILMTNL